MKTLRLLLCMLLCLPIILLPCRALALAPLRDDDIRIAAPSAILMEKITGQVLYEKDADARLLPASVTKVMTLLLIVEDIEAGKLALDDVVTASPRAASFGGSCVYLEEGEQMSVHEMLKCITVASANDCAVAMAEHISGTEGLFVERMNARAEELGLQNTHFSNCTGLFEDEGHYSSARDIALMSRELISHLLIKDYSTIWMDSIRGGSFGLSNTNKLVRFYRGCTGLKTGYTSSAGHCLSASAERDGMELIAVVLHCASSAERFSSAKALLDYGFANYALVPLEPEEAAVPIRLGAESELVPVPADGSPILIEKARRGDIRQETELLPELDAPIEEGEQLGTLRVYAGDEEIASMPLVAPYAVERLGFWAIARRMLGAICLGA